MGTNYYMHSPICPCCGRSDTYYHLGKSSGGWTFHFKGNRDLSLGPLVRTFAEWKADIESKLAQGWVIEDEYTEPVTLEELLTLVESKRDAATDYVAYVSENLKLRGDEWHDDEGNSFSECHFS